MAHFPTVDRKNRFALIIANCHNLPPAHNDILLSYRVLKQIGFDDSNIRYLAPHYDSQYMDNIDPNKKVPRSLITATKTFSEYITGISKFMSKVIHVRGERDFFFALSSHGFQIPSNDLGEVDGLDEAIVVHGNVFKDDDFYNYLFRHLTSDTRAFSIFDTCHSGTMGDLNYSNGKKERSDKNTKASIISFSACSDSEVSWNATSEFNNTLGGTTFVSLYDHMLKHNNPYLNVHDYCAHASSRLMDEFKQTCVVSKSRSGVFEKPKTSKELDSFKFVVNKDVDVFMNLKNTNTSPSNKSTSDFLINLNKSFEFVYR
jgi:hypothetical protein